MTKIKGTLTFFERQSCPSDQRPYELLFQPPDSTFPVCNYTVEQVPDVSIQDMRPLKDQLSLDKQGFLVADLNTSMTYEDHFNQETLKSIYLPEVKALLKSQLGIRAAYVHECVVSWQVWLRREDGGLTFPDPPIRRKWRSLRQLRSTDSKRSYW
jgi:hypothetical protein